MLSHFYQNLQHMWATNPTEIFWTSLGLAGQAFFMSRFIVQWLASEKAGRSVVPITFWYLSIGGGLIVLVYAIYRKDIVFILGQLLGIFVYARNLYLIYRSKKLSSVNTTTNS